MFGGTYVNPRRYFRPTRRSIANRYGSRFDSMLRNRPRVNRLRARNYGRNLSAAIQAQRYRRVNARMIAMRSIFGRPRYPGRR